MAFHWVRRRRQLGGNAELMELLSALLGALVGGAIAAAVGWAQTRTALRHELELHREALESERRSSHQALVRVAAADALAALAALDAAMPHMDFRFAHLGGQVPGYVRERRRRAEQAVADLRRAQVASVPLLDPDLQSRWSRLLVDADEASRADVIGSEVSQAAAQRLAVSASEMHDLLVAAVKPG